MNAAAINTEFEEVQDHREAILAAAKGYDDRKRTLFNIFNGFHLFNNKGAPRPTEAHPVL